MPMSMGPVSAAVPLVSMPIRIYISVILPVREGPSRIRPIITVLCSVLLDISEISQEGMCVGLSVPLLLNSVIPSREYAWSRRVAPRPISMLMTFLGSA